MTDLLKLWKKETRFYERDLPRLTRQRGERLGQEPFVSSFMSGAAGIVAGTVICDTLPLRAGMYWIQVVMSVNDQGAGKVLLAEHRHKGNLDTHVSLGSCPTDSSVQFTFHDRYVEDGERIRVISGAANINGTGSGATIFWHKHHEGAGHYPPFMSGVEV